MITDVVAKGFDSAMNRGGMELGPSLSAHLGCFTWPATHENQANQLGLACRAHRAVQAAPQPLYLQLPKIESQTN
eukprot:5455915-Amphidinium_carterae.1